VTSSTLAFILGTRPEIIKLSPVIRECDRRGISFILIHTGQHYSDELDSVFFETLGLPVPEYNLEIGSASHGEQTGRMIEDIEAVLLDEQPDIVLVQGDTNSVLAGGIAASKLDGIETGHVEAGLRSYDWEMPEEVNRRLVDHASEYLFAPTEAARENLLDENLPNEFITVTGNTIVDAVEENVQIAREESEVLSELGIDGEFALLTAHRAENVDDKDRFMSLLDGVSQAVREYDWSVVYPIHPRARERLEEFEIEVPAAITLVEPLDFLDFLLLEDRAELIFTDSGGVQEESCILQTPCVTLRDNTERPETVDVGANTIVGVKSERIREGVETMLAREPTWENPFGDGTAAEQILDTIESNDR